MDSVLRSLVDFVDTIDAGALPDSAVGRVVRHTFDAVGCGAGGFDSPPARIARQVVRGMTGGPVASVYGEPVPVPVGHAAFANATANRYLDFNDFGISGHPSDMVPALLGLAEARGATGADAVVAIYVAYEIATRLAEAVPPDGGWDQGLYCSLGIAAGQAKLLGLDRSTTAHALSLAAVSGVPLRVTRFGELSEWKASATGFAATSASFAVQLAAAGMTGPPAPFEGKDGLLERVWPTFDLDLAPAAPSAIERASLKRHPACYWGQVPVDLAVELRDRIQLDQVVTIEVATCDAALRAIGGGRGDAEQKWRPQTRETADHSMPYLMAVAVVDGRLSEEAFTVDRLADPALLSVMDRITVVEDARLSARATRDTCPTEVVVRLRDGGTESARSETPRGHHANPMTDDEVADKFWLLAGHALVPPRAGELAGRLRGLATASSLAEIGSLFRSFAVPEGP